MLISRTPAPCTNVYAGVYAFNIPVHWARGVRREVNVISGKNITTKERPLSELFLFSMFEPYASCIPIGLQNNTYTKIANYNKQYAVMPCILRI